MGSKWRNNPAWFGIAGGDVTLAARLLANPEVVLTNWPLLNFPGLVHAVWTTGPSDFAFGNTIPFIKLSPRFPYGIPVEPALPSVNTATP